MFKTGQRNSQNKAITEMLCQLEKLFVSSADGCWLWPKYRGADGYGMIHFDGNKYSVHRLSFQHFKGVIPRGMHVMHECDTPACFNPKHLYLGTPSENMQDMVRKGRHGRQNL